MREDSEYLLTDEGLRRTLARPTIFRSFFIRPDGSATIYPDGRGVSLREAFRRAKEAAGWHREIAP